MLKLVTLGLIALNGAAHAQPLELKGLRVGMSENEFKKSNPTAVCEKAFRDPSLDKAKPALPSLRTCNIPGYTLANRGAERNQFLFFGGRLGSMFHSFHVEDAKPLQAAFTEKYGQPLVDASTGISHWAFDTETTMRLREVKDDGAYVLVESDISRAYAVTAKAATVKRAQSDL